MALTRELRETVLVRAQKDRASRQAMLTEAVNELLTGNFKAGKAMLCCAGMHECRGRRTRRSGRDYINATITFDRLAALLDKPSKSLQRMLGTNGNPTAENIFSLIKTLQQTERVRLRVNAAKKAA